MNNRRYTKFLTGLGSSLILLSMVGTSAMTAAGDMTLFSVGTSETYSRAGQSSSAAFQTSPLQILMFGQALDPKAQGSSPGY